MRNLPRAGMAAAVVLAVTATAGAFTFRPAAGSAPAPARGRAAGPGRIWPGGPAVLAPGQHLPSHPAMSTTRLVSLNWGGYAASRPGVRFRFVQSSFFVPYLNCAATPQAQSAHWVGLDGLRNSTVEQTGISADCNGSRPSYRPWYEMVPNPPVFPNVTIRPGDVIVASVYYDHRTRKFTLSLTDTTNGHHFSRTRACPDGADCQRASAEAISEPPLGPGGYLPLANFRAEGYSSTRVTDQPGHRSGLRGRRWDTTKITTVNESGAILDQPTALHGGSAFGTYWMRAR